MQWKVRTKIWLYPAEKAAWHFITLSKSVSASIKAMSQGMRSSLCSVRVVVTLKGETWKTSLFPAKEAGAYLLPIKAGVRRAARVGAGDMVSVCIELQG